MLRTRKTLQALFAAGALVVVPAATADTPKAGGTLTVGGEAGLRHFNPAVQSGGATGVPGTQIFAGLVRIDAQFNPKPYLAKSWSQSDDGLAYTFNLVEGATFHDGQPITAEDVAFSVDVVRQYHPFGKAMFGAVERVDTPTPTTAVFRLKQRHPALLQSLAPVLLPILPKHVYGDGQNPKTHPMNNAPVGSGPFKFKEWSSGQHVILEKNQNYFIEGRPYLDRIVLKFIKKPSARIAALEQGGVDLYPFAGVRFRDVPKLNNNPNLTVTSTGYAAPGPVNYIEFNLRKAPFDNQRVRKAVAYAIDQDHMVERLFGNVPKHGYSPFHHANPYHSKNLVGSYGVDLDKAKALLDEAGYKADAGGTRLRVTLDYPTFHADSLGAGADYVKTQLKKVGIEVRLRKPVNFRSWAKQIASWDYQFTMNNHWTYPDPVLGVHRIYLCSNIKNNVWANTQGYCNERVDALLQQAATTSDMSARKQLYAEFQDIVNDELPLYFLNEEPYVTVYHNAVKNPPLTVWGAMQPLDEVWLDR